MAGLVLLASGTAHAQAAPRWAELLGRMTVDEKFWQLFMLPGHLDDPAHDYSHGVFGLQVPPAATARADAERINAIQRYFVERTRLGIPMIPFEEAVHGLTRPGATAFPQAIALAATWDTALMGRVATAIARETRSRGIRQVLAPVVNVATDVRWGRVEETYGEDPQLASAMARAYVTALEGAQVVTTPKHFVANVGDGGRDSYPIELDDYALAEIHFPSFRAALDAGARSIMTAYNSVGGLPMSQNRRLLTETLRRRWGFSGYVISDASATAGATVLHLTEPTTAAAARHAFEAGLDVVFQSAWPDHRPYLDAFRQGVVPADMIDSAVARVLRAKAGLGLFDAPYANPDSAAFWNGHADHRRLAREAAAAAMVLLKNDASVLPIRPAARSIAVIGPDAVEARLGGYSGPGVAPVGVLAALEERLGSRVRYFPGPGRSSPDFVTVPASRLALTVSSFDNPSFRGTARETRRDSIIDARWTFNPPVPELDTEWYSVRWEGTLTVGTEPARRLGVDGSDGWRLYLDDRLVIDRWRKVSAGAHLAAVDLAPGSRHRIRLEFFETTGDARVRLVWDAGVSREVNRSIARAAAGAKASEVAIVVAGIEEGEFRDRARLGLPGQQEALIDAVAATGTPTVVVLIGGSAITMPWLDAVDGVVMAWYPGEAGGQAIADVLFGDVSPAGRLPITFPIAEGQLPLVYNHRPTGRGNDYLDLTGKPLFPFGFGLSYTSFEYSDLSIEPGIIGPTDTVIVRARIRNTGGRSGDEVVQLYLRDRLASRVRPVISLQGFARLHLAPGESAEVAFALGPAQMGVRRDDRAPVVEPGRLQVYLGASSRDARLRGEVVVR